MKTITIKNSFNEISIMAVATYFLTCVIYFLIITYFYNNNSLVVPSWIFTTILCIVLKLIDYACEDE